MPGKWIDIASPDLPATEVAAEVLRTRLQYVQQILPLAAHQYQCDVEHVHQLRVACRRAGASVQAFRPLLKGKSKRLRKWLRRIRQAAGPARDADVLLARLRSTGTGNPNLEYLIARLERRRADVQEKLVQVEARTKPGKLSKSLQGCLDYLGGRKSTKIETTIEEFAGNALQKASQPMQQLAAIDHPSVSQLHELRIAGKRLRYSIEIFHAAVSPKLREKIYPLIENLQNRLGRINDHSAAQMLFQDWLADMPANSRAAYLASCIVEEDSAARRLREEFLEWWTDDRVALLESYLSTLAKARA